MRFTQKLLSFLHRVFDKDPASFLALRLQYDGGLTWQIADARLTTTVAGGSGANLSVDLSQYTVAGLVGFIAAQPGYSIPYADRSELATLSARVLLDGSGDIGLSNGDHLYGYTNELWSYLEASASELQTAAAQIPEAIAQLSTKTSRDYWLDVLGDQYGVRRVSGESDDLYGPRIIAEVVRPRGNNVAIEAAIREFTGQSATVTDVVLYGPTFPLYNGQISRNSEYQYSAHAVPIYGLFDVQYAYDLLNGGDVSAFQQSVLSIVQRLRDAGTQLRALSLTGSALSDALTPPTDASSVMSTTTAIADTLTPPTDSEQANAALAGFADSLTAPLEGVGLVVMTQYRYNSVRKYNGAIYRLGISTNAEDVGTAGDIPFTSLLTANGNFNADGSQVADGLL